jgi:hypothetical protein
MMLFFLYIFLKFVLLLGIFKKKCQPKHTTKRLGDDDGVGLVRLGLPSFKLPTTRCSSSIFSLNLCSFSEFLEEMST